MQWQMDEKRFLTVALAPFRDEPACGVCKGPPLHQQLNEKEGNTRQGMGDRPVGETEGEWGGGKRVEGAGWWVNTDFHQRERDREIF